MSTEIDILEPTVKGFDTINACVYDLPAFSNPDQAQIMAPNAHNEKTVPLKGLYGWLANSLGVHPWGQVLIAVLALQFVFGYRWLSSMDQHLTKIDTAIQVMPLEISRDLLSQASADITLGKPDRAATTTEAASALIAQSSIKHIAADPEYFASMVANLNLLTSRSPGPAFAQKVNTARLTLADYRSSLKNRPDLSQQKSRTMGDSYTVVRADSTT
ncbi:MAG: hypothetical protein WAN97_12065, partial [Candidatus Acidiferrales bacterium]